MASQQPRKGKSGRRPVRRAANPPAAASQPADDQEPGPSTRSPTRPDPSGRLQVPDPGTPDTALMGILRERIHNLQRVRNRSGAVLKELERAGQKESRSAKRGSHTGPQGKMTQELLIKLINRSDRWDDICTAVGELINQYDEMRPTVKGNLAGPLAKRFGLGTRFTRQVLRLGMRAIGKDISDAVAADAEEAEAEAEVEDELPEEAVQALAKEEDPPEEQEVDVEGGMDTDEAAEGGSTEEGEMETEDPPVDVELD